MAVLALSDAGIPAMVPVPWIAVLTSWMESSTLSGFVLMGTGLRLSAFPSCAVNCCNSEYTFASVPPAAWLAAAFCSITPSGLVVCCGDKNEVSREAAAELTA